jgi:hypothetical protein
MTKANKDRLDNIEASLQKMVRISEAALARKAAETKPAATAEATVSGESGK